MTDINILPIFNQAAPNIWDDFLRIRASAMQHVYNHNMTQNERDDARAEYAAVWRRRGFNFAFGAYNGSDIVGFVNGDCVNRVATIRGLYVLPECMSNNIGGQLLKYAESAGAMGARLLDLVSLLKSCRFYEKHGYRAVMRGSNQYRKKIQSKIQCKTVPVFHTPPAMTRECVQISSDNHQKLDMERVNVEHLPMFAYLDSMSVTRGFIVDNGPSGTEIYIGAHQPVDFIAKRLMRAHGEWSAAYQKIMQNSQKIH